MNCTVSESMKITNLTVALLAVAAAYLRPHKQARAVFWLEDVCLRISRELSKSLAFVPSRDFEVQLFNAPQCGNTI